jgi:hypothetical protein
MRRLFVSFSAGMAVLSTGCGVRCTFTPDNIQGRVLYSNSVTASDLTRLRIEAIDVAETTVLESKSIDNSLGFTAVSYSLCVDPSVPVKIRAFEDTNLNESFDAGEPNGRDDDDDTAHGTYRTITVDNDGDSDGKVKDIDITLDQTAAQ